MDSEVISLATDRKRSADKMIGKEAVFAVPAIADEGVVSTGGAEVEASEVGGKRCAGVVGRQPVVAKEDRRFVGAVAGNSADFVVLRVPRRVEGLRKREMADAGLLGEIPPPDSDRVALSAFLVLIEVAIRHAHFRTFEDVFDCAMLWTQSANAGA